MIRCDVCGQPVDGEHCTDHHWACPNRHEPGVIDCECPTRHPHCCTTEEAHCG